MKVLKNIFLSLMCVMMTGCVSSYHQSNKVETTNMPARSVRVMKPATLFKGQDVTMSLQGYTYNKSQKAFIIQTKVQNKSRDEVEVDYDTCLVHGYQVPLHMNFEEVDAHQTINGQMKIFVADLNKAGITFNQAKMRLVIEKEDDQKLKETITIPLKAFKNYQAASKAYVKKKKKKVIFNAKGVKASFDRYDYDRQEQEYVMQVTITNNAAQNIELKANNMRINGHYIDLDEEDNEVKKGKKRVAEYRMEAKDLTRAGVNPVKSGAQVTLVLENDDNDQIIAKKHTKIPAAYFKA